MGYREKVAIATMMESMGKKKKKAQRIPLDSRKERMGPWGLELEAPGIHKDPLGFQKGIEVPWGFQKWSNRGVIRRNT